ncbi:acyltransferase [Microvirga terrae]|uniref:Acyltransferase n=1 Tax=Microvirga terrae TaxID=2740529 RepID=A0ABY5RN38_9HYPH|nr:acyltransferase [Microvirga terrae]UVF18403.1 acyltransferase [Microvirga terrae]
MDSLRGIAALIVMLSHCYGALPPAIFEVVDPWVKLTPLRIIRNAHSWVIFFFVLSGFVLSLGLISRFPLTGYGKYVIKRFVRIYIPFAGATSIAIPLAIFFAPMPHELGGVFDDNWSKPVTLRATLEMLLMLGTRSGLDLNGVSWSLFYELRISVLLPFLCLLLINSRWLPGLLYITVATVAVLLIETGGNTAISEVRGTIHYSTFFVIGAMIAATGNFWRCLLQSFSNLARACCALFGLALMLPYSELANGAGSLILIVVTLNSESLQSFLSKSILTWLGRVSFSLYLTHLIVLLSIGHAFAGALPVPALLALAVLMSLLVAELFHRMVEAPAINISRAIGKNSKPALVEAT